MFIVRLDGSLSDLKREAPRYGVNEEARLYSGRWNKEGTPPVYTSSSMELALLEATVHFEGLPPAGLPPYSLVTIELPEEAISYPAVELLPLTGSYMKVTRQKSWPF